MTRLYISGPMTGYLGMNFDAFNEAAALLRAAGYEVVNPAELGEVDGWTWEEYLKRDIPEMLTCDGVALLDKWHLSKGSLLEQDIAVRLNMRACQVDWWLER